MASHPNDPNELRKLNRELSDALHDCEQLLQRARKLLRRSGQDNDPLPRK